MKQNKNRPQAILVGVQLPGISLEEHEGSLAELKRLCTTLGFDVVGTLSQARKSLSAATVVGEGKLKDIAKITGGTGVVETLAPKRVSKAKKRTLEGEEDFAIPAIEDFEEDDDDDEGSTVPGHLKASVVVFDNDITPTQLRNLEQATDAEILDRTGVIVEIFNRHAQTREAKLQVEIAKLKYLAPRLRMSNTGGDRQGGGIGAKGAGETAHELDRRRIRDRIAELKGQLDLIGKDQANRRSRRAESLRVALVGYTNAGKSSLMRALTGSEVLVADKLFATLDTTVRVMQPETMPKILISDTVGFIKKLPHDLVASFRSTLDEALAASLLLFVVDASDPTFRSQLEVTRTVLGEIGATDIEHRLILNKADRLSPEAIAALRIEFPDGIILSTRNPDDVRRMHGLILNFFEKDMVDQIVILPYEKSALIGTLRQEVRILEEIYDDEGMKFKVRGHPDILLKLKNLIRQSS